MGSETIKIYIPVERLTNAAVEKFKIQCISYMDSLTINEVTKYIKDNHNKLVCKRCECVTCYGKVNFYKDIIKAAAIELAVALDLEEMLLEINDVIDRISYSDIEFCKNNLNLAKQNS